GRVVAEWVMSEVGRLDAEAIDEVRQDAWPDLRDAEELHDLLLTVTALPLIAELPVVREGEKLARRMQASVGVWQGYFEQLASERRATAAEAGGKKYWVAAERGKTFARVFANTGFEQTLP